MDNNDPFALRYVTLNLNQIFRKEEEPNQIILTKYDAISYVTTRCIGLLVRNLNQIFEKEEEPNHIYVNEM